MTTSLTSSSSTALVRAEQQVPETTSGVSPKPLSVGDRYLHRLCDQRQISLSTRYWVGFDQLPLRKFQAVTHIIDAKVWNDHVDLAKYELDVRGPHIPMEEVIPVAVDLAKYVEDGKGITILTVPKGLTYNKMMAIARENGVPIRREWDRVAEVIGNDEVQETYVVALTNGLFKDTRSKRLADQKTHLEERGYQVAAFINVLALAILRYKVTGGRIFSNDVLYTYARTLQMVDGRSLTVAGFAPAGFCVGNSDFIRRLSHGVGGQWKLTGKV